MACAVFLFLMNFLSLSLVLNQQQQQRRHLPKPENAKLTHLTQQMYLPYERTRK
jgi:hypothetical protein